MSIARKLMSIQGGGNGWISILSGANTDVPGGLAIDSQGNIIVSGNTSSFGAGGNDIFLVKYAESGSILWFKTYGTSIGQFGNGCAVASNGDIIAGGAHDLSVDPALILRCDSDGAVIWTRTLSQSSGQSAIFFDLDASGNIYFAGRTSVQGPDAWLGRLTSSGAFSWSRRWGSANSGATTVSDSVGGMVVDDSGNFYFAGGISSASDVVSDAYLAKLNSTGAVQWTRRWFSGFQTQEFLGGTCFDPSGNIISVGFGGGSAMVVKYNTSGTLLWRKHFNYPGFAQARSVDVDGDGNIFVVSTVNNIDNTNFHIGTLVTKLDPSGDVVFGKRIKWTSGSRPSIAPVQVKVLGDSLYVCCSARPDRFSSANDSIFTARLPLDGSGNGTYGSFLYDDAAVTQPTPSLSTSTSGVSNATLSQTSGTLTLTTAAASPTEQYFSLS